MIPIRRWLPVMLMFLFMVCQCHRGRKPEAGPQTQKTLTVMLYGVPDSGLLCRAAEAVEGSLAKKDFVKSLHVTGYEENEIVIEADPDRLAAVGMEFGAFAEAVRQGLPAVPDKDMKAVEEKKAVIITMTECRPLDLDADQVLQVTVKDPQGNFIPLGSLAVLNVQAGSRGIYHQGGRALKVEVALGDTADYEEAKESLGRTLAELTVSAPFQWKIH